jgi:hypothetical protein
MTIDTDAAGVLAEVYAVAVLVLAVEGRFLRGWSQPRALRVARMTYTIAAFVTIAAAASAVAAMVTAIITDTQLKGFSVVLVIVAGFALAFMVPAFLGGALLANTGVGTGQSAE